MGARDPQMFRILPRTEGSDRRHQQNRCERGKSQHL
jgi:hypothetical protein